MDYLEMLAKLEDLQEFVFLEYSQATLRFSFSSESKDVYVRLVSADDWQKEYLYENQRIKVPEFITFL